jgi:hypothetical protein
MNAITLLVMCGSVWGLFQIAAVLFGWRFTKLRAEAVVEWQDCDVKDRPDWNDGDVEAVAELVREVVDQERSEEEQDDEAAHFLRWEAEVTDKRIAKYERRMDRWSQ